MRVGPGVAEGNRRPLAAEAVQTLLENPLGVLGPVRADRHVTVGQDRDVMREPHGPYPELMDDGHRQAIHP